MRLSEVMRGNQFAIRSERKAHLSAPQMAVLEAVAKRTTIKQIASELNVSESAINKRIRTLKLQLGANTLAELSQIYDEISEEKTAHRYRKPAGRKNHLPYRPDQTASLQSDGIGPVVTFHEALSYRQPAPWEGMQQVNVVPEVLNGVNGKWHRGILIILLTIGLFVSIVVGLGAAQGLSSALANWRSASASSD